LTLYHIGCIILTMSSKLSVFIKQKRKYLKLNQIELSEKSGVGLRFIREMEQGKKTLRMDKVNQVLVIVNDFCQQFVKPNVYFQTPTDS